MEKRANAQGRNDQACEPDTWKSKNGNMTSKVHAPRVDGLGRAGNALQREGEPSTMEVRYRKNEGYVTENGAKREDVV